jgi:hypothetical protein
LRRVIRQPRENPLMSRSSSAESCPSQRPISLNPHTGTSASQAEPSALAKTNPGLRIMPHIQVNGRDGKDVEDQMSCGYAQDL